MSQTLNSHLYGAFRRNFDHITVSCCPEMKHSNIFLIKRSSVSLHMSTNFQFHKLSSSIILTNWTLLFPAYDSLALLSRHTGKIGHGKPRNCRQSSVRTRELCADSHRQGNS